MPAELMTWDPATYHADTTAVSHTALDCFIDDPALYYGRYVSKVWPQEDKDTFTFGRILHEVFLFDRDLSDVVIEIPASVLSKSGSRAGQAWKDFAAECAEADRTPLFAEEIAAITAMCGAIFSHPLACKVFESEGPVEAPIVWTDHRGLKRKAMLDKLATRLAIGDLKGMANVDLHAFRRSAYDYGYHRQAAYYVEAARELTGDEWPFLFVAVKKTPSYACEVIMLDEGFVELGRQENEDALDRLVECRETGRWHRRDYGKIVTIEAPAWALKQRELVTV